MKQTIQQPPRIMTRNLSACVLQANLCGCASTSEHQTDPTAGPEIHSGILTGYLPAEEHPNQDFLGDLNQAKQEAVALQKKNDLAQ